MGSHDDGDDAPLDPAAERLRRKLSRLLIVSGGFMLLGFVAVFAAIVYKLSHPAARDAANPAAYVAAPVEAAIAVSSGARLAAADLDGDRALLQLDGPDGTASLILIDLASGRVLGRYQIRPQ
jgi:hypothetical protein